MVRGSCKNQNCTVAETGICLEQHENPSNCPLFIVSKDLPPITEPELAPVQTIGDSVPVTTSLVARRFHSGNELGTDETIGIMRKRYTYLIGVLGSINVGKTCLLSSLYLLASQAELMPEYQFSGSLTLQGYEERARGLRAWQGGHLTDQLVEHTLLQDPRRPAFMHLCLQDAKSRKKLDLLFTDLPGEWTDNLINQEAASSQLGFLKRADGILYVIDGPKLKNLETRLGEIYRAKIAVDRLVTNVKLNIGIPLIFVVSKGDEIDMQLPKGIDPILDHARQLGVAATSILTTAFSRKPEQIKSGLGIMDTIKPIIEPLCLPQKYLNVLTTVGRSFWHI